MKYSKFYFLFFIFFSLEAFAQIDIDANTTVSGKKFKINITENKKTYKLILKIKEGESKDQNYWERMKFLGEKYLKLYSSSMSSKPAMSAMKRMERIIDRNTIYSVYKIRIKKENYTDYDSLIKLVKISGKKILREEQNRNRIVLDGTTVKVKIRNHKNLVFLYCQSPNKDSHPEISSLITKTLDVFREKKLISADKSKFSGY